MLFIRKIPGLIFTLYSLYLIIKGILYFIFSFKVYKLLGLNDKLSKEYEEKYMKLIDEFNLLFGFIALLFIIKILVF